MESQQSQQRQKNSSAFAVGALALVVGVATGMAFSNFSGPMGQGYLKKSGTPTMEEGGTGPVAGEPMPAPDPYGTYGTLDGNVTGGIVSTFDAAKSDCAMKNGGNLESVLSTDTQTGVITFVSASCQATGLTAGELVSSYTGGNDTGITTMEVNNPDSPRRAADDCKTRGGYRVDALISTNIRTGVSTWEGGTCKQYGTQDTLATYDRNGLVVPATK